MLVGYEMIIANMPHWLCTISYPMLTCGIIVKYMIIKFVFQEFKDIWSNLDLILDGGVLGLTEQCRKGSTVVNLSVPDKFSIIREGRY